MNYNIMHDALLRVGVLVHFCIIYFFVAPDAPDGSKWERNLPPPPHVRKQFFYQEFLLHCKDLVSGTRPSEK